MFACAACKRPQTGLRWLPSRFSGDILRCPSGPITFDGPLHEEPRCGEASVVIRLQSGQRECGGSQMETADEAQGPGCSEGLYENDGGVNPNDDASEHCTCADHRQDNQASYLSSHIFRELEAQEVERCVMKWADPARVSFNWTPNSVLHLASLRFTTGMPRGVGATLDRG